MTAAAASWEEPPGPWHLPSLADDLTATLGELEAALRLEQSPHGLDEWRERRLQQALADGLRRRHEVRLEVHYPSSAGEKLSHRQRCDVVLGPRSRPLEAAPEAALWLELKVAHERRAGGTPHPGYGQRWRHALVADLRKLAAEPGLRQAALALVVFTADDASLDRDLQGFELLLADHELLAGFRHQRRLGIVDRIGHGVCGVALWPVI